VEDARPITEQHAPVAGLETFRRSADPPPGVAPTLYLHGVPTSSDDWLPFLERTGGVAPDLPGFGRSDKPSGFDYSIGGYRDFLVEFVESAGLERFSLVTHDWGSVGLALAQAMPERVHRLVAFNGVVGLRDYRWHRMARVWRAPVAGEMAMGFTYRFSLKLISREANHAEGPMPDDFLDSTYRHFDHGTQRAILKLYRASPEHLLDSSARGLDAVRCPALVLHSMADPYIPAKHSHDVADRLGGPVQLEELEDAGHWPWIGDRPDLIDTVADFLTG
jgi:pimeloyl-ACP methyl ester carboxylesterase